MLALEPARAAAEREAGDAGARHAAAGRGQAVLLGRASTGPTSRRRRPGRCALRVDVDVVHRAHVEHEPVVDEADAGDGVPAGAHGDLEALLAGEGERGDDVVGRGALRDVARAHLDHGVEEGAGVLVGGGAGLVQAAAQPVTEDVGGGEGGDRHGRRRYGRRAPPPSPFRPSRRGWPGPARSRPAGAAAARRARAARARRVGHGRGARSARELRAHVGHVAVHGVRAHDEPLRHLRVAQPSATRRRTSSSRAVSSPASDAASGRSRRVATGPLPARRRPPRPAAERLARRAPRGRRVAAAERHQRPRRARAGRTPPRRAQRPP